MISLALALSACGSLNAVPDLDTQGLVADSSETETVGDSGTTGLTDTDTFEADPSAPVITGCDAYCWYHQTGEQFYEWAIECYVTDPVGPLNIWRGRWECVDGSCTDQEGKIACTKDTGSCTTSFKETQFTPNILCEQAPSYTFKVWVSDWDDNESKGFRVTGRME